MARDSSGNYSLPEGAFVTGTVIESDPMNNNFNDIASTLTNSLDRNGNGGMLARLRGVDGTSALPAYAFTTQTTLGIYRAGAGDLRISNNGTDIAKFTTSGVTIYPSLEVQGASSFSDTLTITDGGLAVEAGGLVVDASGADITGSLPATGGVTGASRFSTTGSISTAANDSHAILGLTNFQAGATNNPVRLNVRTQNINDTVDEWQDVRVGLSYDVDNTPALGGSLYISPREGVRITSGTSATATAPANALELVNGNLKLSGAAPNSDEAISNVLTPLSFLKAYAQFTATGVGSISLDTARSLNCASIAITGGDAVITWAAGFASSDYLVLPFIVSHAGTVAVNVIVESQTTTTATIRGLDTSNNQVSMATNSAIIAILVLGAQ